ncbi:metallophosphoesterase [Cryobacterium sp. Y57]|uniref:metallophosphoesterase family protein n=1 Tax=Cryobacterium sp. Y57 TaxID=2048287 RepID=UPI000CE409E5|nr:metallophosphoesterase [Cryobacterium sp. Y57]
MDTFTDATGTADESTEFVILHLTDTHLIKDAGLHYGSVDTVAALARVLRRAGSLGHVDVIACSGDLSDDGSAESYALLQSQLEPWAGERGAAIVYAMGNHDRPEGFGQVLGDGHDAFADREASNGLYGVSNVSGLRVITLNSTVAGKGYGALDSAQLLWLRGVLAEPSANGSMVVLHHPPVAAETELLGALQLHDPEALRDALTGGDVRLILAGHYHYPMVDQFAGIPVVISAAVCNLADIFAEAGTESAFTGSGASIIRLPRNGGTPRILPFSAMDASDAGDGRRVFHFNSETVARIIAAAG